VLSLLPSLVLAQAGGAGGLDLLVEHRCVACHAPPAELAERLPVRPASVLDGIGGRVHSAWLSRYLAADGGHLPELMAAVAESGEPDEHDHAQRGIVWFLSAHGGPIQPHPPAADPGELERGRRLYHGVGCVACHAPFELAKDLATPLWDFAGGFEGEPPSTGMEALPLDRLAEKTRVEALTAYLLDPLAVRPSGEMPSLRLDAAEARAIAAYLLSPEAHVDGPAFEHEPGLIAEYFEAEDPSDTFDVEPTRVDVAHELSGIDALPPHRDEGFAFRFQGFVDVPADGMWTLASASDDGSRLALDGERWIDNWSDHPVEKKSAERWLAAGRHALEVEFYERSGGQDLIVSWSGPGTPEAPIPAEAFGHWKRRDPVANSMLPFNLGTLGDGPARFAELRCGACHALTLPPEPGAPPARARELAELDARASDGCLAENTWKLPLGVPRYALSPAERAAMVFALEHLGDVDAAEDDAVVLERTLERLNCRACHARDGRGGPGEERGLYFQVKGDLDLGDEGRLPPALDHAGWKLRPAALAGVLQRGEGVRPYMRTRMPDFGSANVGHLPGLFARLDARAEVAEPAFDARDVELGRQLAGRERLGCVQCHDVAGHAGLGIPAADLAYVHDRVRYDWFRELLLHPEAIGMSSRMPYFYAAGQRPAPDVYGGDPPRQVDALWTWLSLGAALPLPDGVPVDGGEYELVPIDRTITAGVFFAGASARCVVVGTPQRVHYAYDVENCQPAAAWKGRFFNAAGTWHGRAGHLEQPMGEDPLRFPRGVPFRELPEDGDADAPWPTRTAGELGYRVLGRGVAADGTPTFRYAFPAGSAEVRVEDTLIPVVAPGATGLRRTLVLSSAAPFRVQHRDVHGARATFVGERERTESYLVRVEEDLRW
jgi:mono/diheme cytochrome c family protein